MPRVPAQLIRPWWNHIQELGQNPNVLLAGTGVAERQLLGPDATLAWGDFSLILERFFWITGGTDDFDSAHRAAWPAQPWWSPWYSAANAESLAGRLQSLFRVPNDPALRCHIVLAEWDQVLVQLELADGCKIAPRLIDIIESLFRVFPESQGLPLLDLKVVRGARAAAFEFRLQPRRLFRWWRSFSLRMRALSGNQHRREKLNFQQTELQEYLKETLQAHSRTRTLNLVGLDLAECTELSELADALARSLNAHMLATGLTLQVESSEPILVSRGVPGPHCQVAELRTAQGRVGEVSVWMETEAIHQDLLEELAPWIAISVQNALAIQTIRSQSDQLARDFEQARNAAAAKRELERHLLRTQKLESLGVMARGVAHDFNNLLVGVLSNAQMASQVMPSDIDSQAQAHLKRIIQTAQQATQLTEQMLTYSGQGGSPIDNQDLNTMVREMFELLQASLPKKVRLELKLAPELPTVDIDKTQFQQVVLNLVRNGAEAIGDRRGTVVLRTDLVDPEDYIEHSEVITNRLPRGDAVLLEVSDTGVGIDTRSHGRVFDPFFSTRGPGRGLGLSSVLGIVRGHRGALSMTSQTGKGSVFQILLPRSIQDASKAIHLSSAPWKGQGTVLIVDDEEVVREALREMLELQGFVAWVAVDGDQALSTFESARERLRVLILDWNMPGLDGVEVYEKIRELDSEIPVILTSAYKPDERILSLKESGNLSFLRKPFTMEALQAAMMQGLSRQQMA